MVFIHPSQNCGFPEVDRLATGEGQKWHVHLYVIRFCCLSCRSPFLHASWSSSRLLLGYWLHCDCGSGCGGDGTREVVLTTLLLLFLFRIFILFWFIWFISVYLFFSLFSLLFIFSSIYFFTCQPPLSAVCGIVAVSGKQQLSSNAARDPAAPCDAAPMRSNLEGQKG